MASKVVLVTGGNNGIGYEAVKALLQSSNPYHVLMGSRSIEKAKAAISKLHEEVPETNSIVETVQIDLTSDESIDKAYQQVKNSPGRLDVLINNAGVAFDSDFKKGLLTLRERFTKAYDVNVAGTNVVTWTFMPLLLEAADPRLIFVAGLAHINQASEKYFPTPDLPAGWPKQINFDPIGYRCSKSALNMLMVDWNHKLKADGVKVWCVAPGMLATDLDGAREDSIARGAGPPSLGGDILRKVVEGEKDADVGKITSARGVIAW